MTDSAQAGIQAANRKASDEASRVEFTAIVTGIREVARVHDTQVWQIALSCTLFTPEQCHGTLTATAASGRTLAIDVTHVERDGSGFLWHTANKPVQDGTRVQGVVYAAKRHD